MSSIGLAIDTTFDDTSIAIIEGHTNILSNLTLSQFKDHEIFGGVLPEIASRKHLEVIHMLINEALKEAFISFKDIDYIGVSHFPGLLGSLLVGVTVAKSLAFALNIPIIGVNHVEAHPYANLLCNSFFDFPCIHLVVAGGHTILMHAKDHFNYKIVGRSIDDAAGECVDKVAKMFGYEMPGGAIIDKISLEYSSEKFYFPRPMLKKTGYNFSFSGLKTAMIRFIKNNPKTVKDETGFVISSFFQSVTDVLISKTFSALDDLNINRLTVSGGLAASKKLKKEFETQAKLNKIKLSYPLASLCTDNAAMVGCLSSFRFKFKKYDNLNLEPKANLN